jgi:hypothetical protein
MFQCPENYRYTLSGTGADMGGSGFISVSVWVSAPDYQISTTQPFALLTFNALEAKPQVRQFTIETIKRWPR